LEVQDTITGLHHCGVSTQQLQGTIAVVTMAEFPMADIGFSSEGRLTNSAGHHHCGVTMVTLKKMQMEMQIAIWKRRWLYFCWLHIGK